MKSYQLNLDEQRYSQYHVIAYVNKQLCIILIDTGACCSHISRDLVTELYESSSSISYELYEGEEVTNNKITSAEIIFSKSMIIQVEIPVDNRKRQENKKVLLGIDFLEHFEYKITKTELILDNIVIPRIDMYYKDIQTVISNV